MFLHKSDLQRDQIPTVNCQWKYLVEVIAAKGVTAVMSPHAEIFNSERIQYVREQLYYSKWLNLTNSWQESKMAYSQKCLSPKEQNVMFFTEQ